MAMQMPSFEQVRPSAPRQENRRAHEQPNLELERHRLEDDFLFRNMDAPHLRHRWSQIAEQFPGQPENMRDALEGSLHHERAEGMFRMFLLHERNSGAQPIANMTRQDVAQAYSAFPHVAELEQQEQRALDLYEKGVEHPWKGKWLDSVDMKALHADL